MANEKIAYISVQGNEYVVHSGNWPKTFQDSTPGAHDGMKAAVLWSMKKGYTVKLLKPKDTVDFNGLDFLTAMRFDEAMDNATAIIESKQDEPDFEVDTMESYLLG